MKRRLLTFVLLLLSFHLLSACGCAHEWVEAACLTPRTCTLCEETEGEALGHDFLDATCTAPKTCVHCGFAEGTPLPHTPGEAVLEYNYIRGMSTATESCTVCDTVLNTTDELISLIENEVFLLTPEDFITRLNNTYQSTGRTDWHADFSDSEQTCSAVIYNSETPYATVIFNCAENDPETSYIVKPMSQNQSNDSVLCQIRIIINFSEIAYYTLQQNTEDPNLDSTAEYTLTMYSEQGESLYKDILIPLYLVCDPMISAADAELSAIEGWSSIKNILVADIEDLRHTTKCGTLSVEYMNFFMANLCHCIHFNASDAYNFFSASENE